MGELSATHFIFYMSFLADLPSSGNLVNISLPTKSNITNYVCVHDTAPPDYQYITNDDVNPLIRSLHKRQQEKQKLKRPRGQVLIAKQAKRQKTFAEQ